MRFRTCPPKHRPRGAAAGGIAVAVAAEAGIAATAAPAWDAAGRAAGAAAPAAEAEARAAAASAAADRRPVRLRLYRRQARPRRRDGPTIPALAAAIQARVTPAAEAATRAAAIVSDARLTPSRQCVRPSVLLLPRWTHRRADRRVLATLDGPPFPAFRLRFPHMPSRVGFLARARACRSGRRSRTAPVCDMRWPA